MGLSDEEVARFDQIRDELKGAGLIDALRRLPRLLELARRVADGRDAAELGDAAKEASAIAARHDEGE